MAEVRHSPLTWRLFDAGFALFRRGFLRPTRFGGRWPFADPGTPLLLVANHVSWWDGFLLREVHRAVRREAPFHTVVVEHQLQQHPMLRRLGGVPVDPTRPASVRGMLRTLARLRRDEPDTVFGYFPQGRIWPTTRRPLEIRRGIEAVARLLAPVRVVPIAIHIEPLVDVRPTPLVWLGDSVDVPRGGRLARADVEQRLERGLDSIRELLDEFGEDVGRAWPRAHPPSAPPHARPRTDVAGGALPDVQNTRLTPS